MSESNPHDPSEKDASAVHRLKSVPPEEAAKSAGESVPAQSGTSSRGGHMTGLLGLLLAVAIFAFLAQFSTNRALTAEVQGLREDLSTALTQLEASRGRLTEARGVVGNLRSQLEELDALLAPPATGEAAGGTRAGGEAGAE